MLFWLAFAIFIFGFFLINREDIYNGIQAVQNEIATRKTPREDAPLPTTRPGISIGPSNSTPASPDHQLPPEVIRGQDPSEDQAPVNQGTPQGAALAPPQQATQQAPQQAQEPPAAAPSGETTVEVQSSGGNTQQVPPARDVLPASVPAAEAPSVGQNSAPAQGSEAGHNPAELRERALYFTQVDRGGSILRVRVSRDLPVSDSPLTDALLALIAGPNAEERRRGLISLIPPDTKLLSAVIRGDTAYLSFSEDFQYNTYGVEGYAAQLKEIIYTVTEFPNIRDVQILIEGRRLDYLGEGIWIGSPLTRDML